MVRWYDEFVVLSYFRFFSKEFFFFLNAFSLRNTTIGNFETMMIKLRLSFTWSKIIKKCCRFCNSVVCTDVCELFVSIFVDGVNVTKKCLCQKTSWINEIVICKYEWVFCYFAKIWNMNLFCNLLSNKVLINFWFVVTFVRSAGFVDWHLIKMNE